MIYIVYFVISPNWLWYHWWDVKYTNHKPTLLIKHQCKYPIFHDSDEGPSWPGQGSGQKVQVLLLDRSTLEMYGKYCKLLTSGLGHRESGPKINVELHIYSTWEMIQKIWLILGMIWYFTPLSTLFKSHQVNQGVLWPWKALCHTVMSRIQPLVRF